ncbi:MAG: 7-carboxy-7-deazaguanine synthase QueE [Crocinitomicaceae bacterium]
MAKAYNIEIEIPLMESFYSIQGEGYHSGRAAYFIRFAGCDVGCTWCDVKESWDAEKHALVSILSIIEDVKASGTDFVVITGGEPGMYNLMPLTLALKAIGMEIAIETSGAYPLTGQLDWICLSPKKFKMPLEENYKKAHELKMIAFNNHDFKWALELGEKVNESCQKFLQPEWDSQDGMLPKVIDFVKSNIDWQISLQTHKFLNVR